MDVVLAPLLSVLLAKFHYVLPLNLPMLTLVSLSCRMFRYRYLVSIISGALVDAMDPFKPWLSPLFFLLSCMFFEYASSLRREARFITLVAFLLIYVFYDAYTFSDELHLLLSRALLTTLSIFIILRKCEKAY